MKQNLTFDLFKNVKQYCILIGVLFIITPNNFITAQYNIELVKDFSPGMGDGFPSAYIEANGFLFLTAYDESFSKELWLTDGTEEGTKVVKKINPNGGSNPVPMVVLGDLLILHANDGVHGSELWKSDGTEEGTQMIKDINPGQNNGVFGTGFVYNDKVYFRANDGVNGLELWVTDGTEEGTYMVKDINPNGNSTPVNMMEVNGGFIFTVLMPGNVYEVWISDGTEENTQFVKALNEPGELGSIDYFVEMDGQVFFRAYDDDYGIELWVTDGTTAGTHVLKNIYEGSQNSVPDLPVVWNDELYFIAADGENGRSLWKSDGTEEGTTLIVTLNPDPAYWIGSLTPYDGKLYFTNRDGTLWFTDGTEEGTHPFTDIYTDYEIKPSLFFNRFEIFDDVMFLRAETDDMDNHLWYTDGTAEGTSFITIDGYTNDNPLVGTTQFAIYNNEMYFGADYFGTGSELYKLTASTVSIAENEKIAFNVYPNPAEDKVIISTEKKANFTLYDLAGKKLNSYEVIDQKEISIEHLNAGVYILKEHNSGGAHKIIKK